jgi:hypothetical protein
MPQQAQPPAQQAPFGASTQQATKPSAGDIRFPMTFKYKYAVMAVEVELTESALVFAQGAIKRKTSVDWRQIRYFYVSPINEGQILFIVEDLPGGKTKRHKFYADSPAADFSRLVDVLAALVPSADLRSKPPAEAMKVMGFQRTGLFVLPLVVLLITAVLSLMRWAFVSMGV